MENVNQLCVKLREDAGLTVQDLADIFGCKKNTISALERSTSGAISFNFVKKYSEYFGEKYFDILAEPLVRYDCGTKIFEQLNQRGVSVDRFAKVINKKAKTINGTLRGYKHGDGGKTSHGFDENEIKWLASYFRVSPDTFRISKYYAEQCGGMASTVRWIPEPKSVPEAITVPVHKTAQMICEEEKKMEYEEALKKAKEYDTLMKEWEDLKKRFDRQEAELDETIDAYNRGMEKNKIQADKIAALEKENHDLKLDYDHAQEQIKGYQSSAKLGLDEVGNLKLKLDQANTLINSLRTEIDQHMANEESLKEAMEDYSNMASQNSHLLNENFYLKDLVVKLSLEKYQIGFH